VDRCAPICARNRFFSIWGKWQPERGTVGGRFSALKKNNNNGNLGWGSVGVAEINRSHINALKYF
jgi:hypothetical protein